MPRNDARKHQSLADRPRRGQCFQVLGGVDFLRPDFAPSSGLRVASVMQEGHDAEPQAGYL
jgi:hypothetical protein